MRLRAGRRGSRGWPGTPSARGSRRAAARDRRRAPRPPRPRHAAAARPRVPTRRGSGGPGRARSPRACSARWANTPPASIAGSWRWSPAQMTLQPAATANPISSSRSLVETIPASSMTSRSCCGQRDPGPALLVGGQRGHQPADVDRVHAGLGEVAGGDLGGRGADHPPAVLLGPHFGEPPEGVGLPGPGRADEHLHPPGRGQNLGDRVDLVDRQAVAGGRLGDPPHDVGVQRVHGRGLRQWRSGVPRPRGAPRWRSARRSGRAALSGRRPRGAARRGIGTGSPIDTCTTPDPDPGVTAASASPRSHARRSSIPSPTALTSEPSARSISRTSAPIDHDGYLACTLANPAATARCPSASRATAAASPPISRPAPAGHAGPGHRPGSGHWSRAGGHRP